MPCDLIVLIWEVQGSEGLSPDFQPGGVGPRLLEGAWVAAIVCTFGEETTHVARLASEEQQSGVILKVQYHWAGLPWVPGTVPREVARDDGAQPTAPFAVFQRSSPFLPAYR